MKRLLPILLFCLLGTLGVAQNFGVQFDGVSGRISLCNSEDFNIGDGFTIEAWIFASEWRATSWLGSIVTKDQQGPDAGYAFRAGDNGTLSMVMSVDGTWFEIQTDPFMNALQWYHVAAVVSNGTLSLYVNGELMNSGTFTGSAFDSEQTVTIGESVGFPGRVWDGVIDEVRIWRIARTAAEISDNQTTSFTGNEAGLVAYLPMNEGSGTIAANLADDTCDGTFNGITDAAWQEGYSIPSIDAGVVSVNAPDVLSIYERPVKVNVTLQNFGSEAISNVPVELDVNGLPTLSSVYEGTLQPGETASFTFPTPLDLRGNNTNLLNAKTTDSEDANSLNDATSYRYKKPDDDLTLLNILNEEQHNFGGAGQTQFTEVNMPVHMEDYDQLLLHFSVECPDTGCDPWDQPASFFVVRDGVEYEIARFITPYGIECGTWTVDVTDFKTILAGPVVFKSFVQVWGSSGWLVNADLEFRKGTGPAYQKVNTLWQNFYWVYGEPTVSYDLEAQTNTIASNSQDAHLRMTITGHGQGNTDNAAEFSNKTHTVMVNNSMATTHNLWKDNCENNSCSDQAGNWLFDRAGWCPGQQVDPFVYDLTSDMTPGQDLTIDYELESYTNLLNTGYNNGSHTEPHYRIAAFLVERSEIAYTDLTNLKANSISLTTNGNTSNPVFESLSLSIENTGTMAVANAVVSYFVNGSFVAEETISTSIAAGASYTHDFATVDGFTAGDDNAIIAIVTATGDENLSDDATGLLVDDSLVNTVELTADLGKIYPNPSTGQFRLELSEDLLNATLEVLDVSGRLVQQRQIVDLNSTLDVANKGMYLLRLTSTEGTQYFQRVVVQ